jgi:hypothetical protein
MLTTVQDEFSFYLEDTASKLLLLPADGNLAARQAAEKLKVPIAHLTVTVNPGELKPGENNFLSERHPIFLQLHSRPCGSAAAPIVHLFCIRADEAWES